MIYERKATFELVDLNFLKICHYYHNKWLLNKDNVTIASDLDLESLSFKLKNLIENLNIESESSQTSEQILLYSNN